jgi:hypothetical protein
MIHFLSEKFMKTGSTAIKKEQWLSKNRHIYWKHCLNTEDIFGKPPKIHQTIQQVMWPSTENYMASHE